MNFTKPGTQRFKQRIFVKAEAQKEWQTLSNLQYVKTRVARRKKDCQAAADSEQDDAEDDQNAEDLNKKKRTQYYYCLQFDYEFECDDDTVYFAFSQPYTYTQIMRDCLQIENEALPSDKALIKNLPRPAMKDEAKKSKTVQLPPAKPQTETKKRPDSA